MSPPPLIQSLSANTGNHVYAPDNLDRLMFKRTPDPAATQDVVSDRPYKFVPPLETNWWPAAIQLYLPRYLWNRYGISSVVCYETERLKCSLKAGHGILLAPNHCRLSDPLVLGILARQVNTHLFCMTSWHLFLQGWFTSFMIRRMGGFSVYREGVDKAAISAAIDILAQARRPLVIFPEGALSRHNDQLMSLMDGTAFIARAAAKKKGSTRIVVHPVAIRYYFRGDLQATLTPVLKKFEEHFGWKFQPEKPLLVRIRQIAEGLLALKEIDYFGHAQHGDVYQRTANLIDHLLVPLEKEWATLHTSSNVVARAKHLRKAIVSDLSEGNIGPDDRKQRWRELDNVYLAQQLSHYLRDYVGSHNNIPEHVLETVERFEEDFLKFSRVHRPMKVAIQVGQAIVVSPERNRNVTTDPVMEAIELQLTQMLEKLAQNLPTDSLKF